jgi:hypothetical protein
MSLLTYAAYRIGGKEKFMELAKLSEDEKIQKIVEKWNKLSKSDHRYVNLDDLIEGTEVTSSYLLDEVGTAAYLNGYQEIGLEIITVFQEHIRIIEESMKRANTEEGFRDRRKLARHMGLIP